LEKIERTVPMLKVNTRGTIRRCVNEKGGVAFRLEA
jgi:hypothetical protein